VTDPATSAPTPPPHARTAEVEGYILGFLGVLVFGTTVPMTRLAVVELDPWFVTIGRALVAATLAAVTLIATGSRVPPPSEWLRFAIFSLAAVLAFPLLLGFAMQHAPASHAGVVLGAVPLMTAMVSVVAAGERPSPAFWVLGVIGLAAVVAYMLIAAKGSASLQWADMYLVATAVSGAVNYAFGGELSRRRSGWEVICWALVIAAPFLALTLWWLAPPINWHASPRAWGGFAFVSVFSMFLGFFAWNKGLALGGIAKVSQIQLLQPFVVLAVSAVLLGERVGALEIGFAGLIVVIVMAGRLTRVRQTR
jgi:drug/metabolite transporter (DMT)-like permease